jgi:SOS-response transcriptional repressor LexA
VKEEEGWWFNKMIKVGQTLQLACLGSRVNKGGRKVVKLTDVEEIVRNAKTKERKTSNEAILELWESLEKVGEEMRKQEAKEGIEQEEGEL